MIEVIFKFPEEMDLAFYYLNRQFERFLQEDILFPEHEIAIGDSEISILMWYPDDEDDSDDSGGGGDDPIWPLPVTPKPTQTLAGYLPEWTQSWS